MTQGDLVVSDGKVGLRWCGTRRRKGEQQRRQTATYSPRKVRGDISASEVLTEALPGVGAGYSTQERHQSKRWRRVATCHHAGRLKRSARGGRPCA